jgi:5-methylthioadenosine/S-adenosylhomocysteine deaminase
VSKSDPTPSGTSEDDSTVDVRLSGGTVITMNHDGQVIDDGYVEVVDNRIVHIGAKPSAKRAVEHLDLTGKLVIPGLINTHCHLSQQLARGLADDVDLLTWLRARIWPYETALTPAEVELSALACALEQIRNGVTTIADPGGQHVDAAGRALQTAGIRGYLARSTLDELNGAPPYMVLDTQSALEVQDELASRWHGAAEGRIRFAYSVRTIFNASDELIEGGSERARRLGTILEMHVAEIPAENEHVIATRGRTTVRHLAELGVLGPGFLAAHAVWIDAAEMELLGSSGAAVSHNLASNLRVLGLPRVADMFDAGITVGLGTDGAPVNNRMSLVDEMYSASLLQKGLRLDPTVLPASQVFRMATIDGAKAVAWDDEIGSLEVGKKADLVIVDPLTANMVPLLNPTSALVTSMKTENIESVMCDGRWLMRNRTVTAFDEMETLREAQTWAVGLARRIGLHG